LSETLSKRHIKISLSSYIACAWIREWNVDWKKSIVNITEISVRDI